MPLPRTFLYELCLCAQTGCQGGLRGPHRAVSGGGGSHGSVGTAHKAVEGRGNCGRKRSLGTNLGHRWCLATTSTISIAFSSSFGPSSFAFTSSPSATVLFSELCGRSEGPPSALPRAPINCQPGRLVSLSISKHPPKDGRSPLHAQGPASPQTMTVAAVYRITLCRALGGYSHVIYNRLYWYWYHQVLGYGHGQLTGV